MQHFHLAYLRGSLPFGRTRARPAIGRFQHARRKEPRTEGAVDGKAIKCLNLLPYLCLLRELSISNLSHVAVMSAGFGWSLSDVRLLAQYAGKIHRALKEENGSASEYQQATATLLSLQTVLEQIQFGLKATDPSFRNALKAQLVDPTNSIASFNTKLQEKYGDKLNSHAPSAPHHGTWPKVRWAFSAADDLKRFWMELSRHLEILKLLILSETKIEVAQMHSKVTENLLKSHRVEQQLHSLQSEIHQSRGPSKVSIAEVHRLCQSNGSDIREIRHANARLATDVHKKFAEDDRDRPDVAAALTDLASRMPLNSMWVEHSLIAAPGVVREGSSKPDTVLATIQELHCLMKELRSRDERHESQYTEIQNRIDELQSVSKDWALEPAELSKEKRYMVWKSRNNMTRTLIGGIDIASAKLEDRSEVALSLFRVIMTDPGQPLRMGESIAIVLQSTNVSSIRLQS